MAGRKASDVKDSLTKKFGFGPAPGDKHEVYSCGVPDVGTVSTHFSRGKKEISDQLLGIMAGQLLVTGSYFRGMLDCKNSCDAWIKQIQEAPVGPLARFRKKRV